MGVTGSSSVRGLVTAIQGAEQQLPYDELAAARSHLENAARIVDGVLEPDGQGGEVRASIAAASERGAAAADALAAVSSNVANYIGSITGGATAEGSGVEPAPTTPTSVPAGNTQQASAELSIDGKAIIENRRLGETPVVFALSKHTTANAPAIAEALRHCDVILVENEGAEDAADRMATQELYGLITSGFLGSESLAFLNEKYKNDWSVQMVLRLQGSGIAVVSVGMNRDNPNYALVADFQASVMKTYADAFTAQPVDTIRVDIRDQLEKAVIANQARDAFLAAQLLSLKDQAVSFKPDATIGVALGAMHYPVMAVTEPAGESSALPLGERLQSFTGIDGEAYMGQREGNMPSDETVDRIALGAYGEMLSMGYEGVPELTRRLKSYELELVMGRIDEIARRDESADQKAMAIGALIRAAVDLFVKNATQE